MRRLCGTWRSDLRACLHCLGGDEPGQWGSGVKLAFVGCGYVFDIYMRTRWAYPEFEIAGVFDIDRARLEVVRRHYGLHAYASLDEILASPDIDIVVNLTSIQSHFEVTRRVLEAGKHVYSEKPISKSTEEVRALFDLAAERGVILAAAPCNIYSDSIYTMWKAVRDGVIGKPVLVYAELDDNPAHLMSLDKVQSPTGAPFPYQEELQEGCTVEHVAYHLVWLCAMFGPATFVTAAGDCLIRPKMAEPLDPDDTSDVSVAFLQFAGGVSARITCSWVAPRNHSFSIIGDAGMICADNIFHDQSPLFLERFSRVSLNARKFRSLRAHAGWGCLFGIGGRRLRLVRRWKSHAVEAERGVGTTVKHKIVSWLRRREVYAQDKLLGIAEMARALDEGCQQPTPADFLIHINEITLLINSAGHSGIAQAPQTSFVPLPFPAELESSANSSPIIARKGILEAWLSRFVHAAHAR